MRAAWRPMLLTGAFGLVGLAVVLALARSRDESPSRAAVRAAKLERVDGQAPGTLLPARSAAPRRLSGDFQRGMETPAPETDEEQEQSALVDLEIQLVDSETGVDVSGSVVLSGIFPSVWTPAEGTRFQIERQALADPRLLLLARATGYMTVSHSLRDHCSQEDLAAEHVVARVALVSAREPVLRVRVLDRDSGEPIPGAAAVLAEAWRSRAPQSRPFAISDKRGFLVVRLDRDFQGPLVVLAEGYWERRLPTVEEATDAGDVLLIPSGKVRCALTVRVARQPATKSWLGWLCIARTGPPIDSPAFYALAPGIERLDTASRMSLKHRERWMVREPILRIQDLWPGDYTIVVWHPELGCATKDISLDGEDKELDLALEPGSQVRPADVLGVGSTVELRHTRVPQFRVVVPGPGAANVPPGTYSVCLKLPSGATVPGGTIEIGRGGSINVELPTASGRSLALSGQMVGPSGLGVAGVSMRLSGGSSTYVTDEEGRFSIPGVAAGSYSLVILSPGYAFQPDARVPEQPRRATRITVPSVVTSDEHDLGRLIVVRVH